MIKANRFILLQAHPGLRVIPLPFPMCISYHTHDVRQDRTRGADERAHDGQQVVVEQEALGTQSPARVAVQHSDDNRHVSTTNGSCQSHTLARKIKEDPDVSTHNQASNGQHLGSKTF